MAFYNKLSSLISRDKKPSARPILTPVHLIDPDPNVQRRIDDLREWRKATAKEKNISAFLILSNRTLMDIAKDNPRTKEALAAVKGMGVKKLESYSDAILNRLS